MFSDLLYRLRALTKRRTVESELDDELRLHLDHEAAKLSGRASRPTTPVVARGLHWAVLSRSKRTAATRAAPGGSKISRRTFDSARGNSDSIWALRRLPSVRSPSELAPTRRFSSS